MVSICIVLAFDLNQTYMLFNQFFRQGKLLEHWKDWLRYKLLLEAILLEKELLQLFTVCKLYLELKLLSEHRELVDPWAKKVDFYLKFLQENLW